MMYAKALFLCRFRLPSMGPLAHGRDGGGSDCSVHAC